MPDPCGLLLLDKPSGPTSHDLVYAVRRGSGVRRVGHAGTLDPLASGLLIMCLGPATRLSEYLAGKDKRYLARVRLGQATTTYDAQGEVTETHADLPLPGQAAVEAALEGFRGRQQQVPPAYSAIKRGGQKAYEMARRGEAVELDARAVEFYSLELVEWQPPELLLNVHCSAGTYIRSLAHDLGRRLGCGAHLSALRRTASGSFDLGEAIALADLQAAFAGGNWLQYLRPPDAALVDWPSVRLTTEAAARVQRGQPVQLDLPVAQHGDSELLARAYNAAGDFIAVLRADTASGVWRPHKVFLEN